MDVKRVGAIAAVIAMASLQPGCSFLFVKGPPANHAEVATFDCSDGYGWPAVDAIWAGLNGLGAATAGDDMDQGTGTKSGPSHDQIVAVGVSWLVVSGISAIYGFSKVSACREAKERRELAANGGPSPAAAQACRDERFRALQEAHKVKDQRERMRLIDAAPVCAPDPDAPVRAAAPVRAPAAAPRATAPATPAATAPAAPATPAATAPATPAAASAPAAPAPAAQAPITPSPTSSLSPRLPLHRAAHPRSLAMRPALVLD